MHTPSYFATGIVVKDPVCCPFTELTQRWAGYPSRVHYRKFENLRGHRKRNKTLQILSQLFYLEFSVIIFMMLVTQYDVVFQLFAYELQLQFSVNVYKVN